MPLTRVNGDFSQVSNIIQITIPTTPVDTNFLLQETGFPILQETGSHILLEGEPPSVTHTLVATGGIGSGAQEPLIRIIFCEGTSDLTPAGQLRVEGGGLGFTNALLLDDVNITNTDNVFGQYGDLVSGEWLDLITIPGPVSDYEVRQTTVSGDDPTTASAAPGEWKSFDFGDVTYGYDGVFVGDGSAGVWKFEIRDRNSNVTKATIIFTVSQILI